MSPSTSSPSKSPYVSSPPRSPSVRAACHAALVVLGLVAGSSAVLAGDSPDAPVGPQAPRGPQAEAPKAGAPQAPGVGAASAAAPSPRAAAVEAEVRALERVLAALRRARTDLRAGRPEPMPVDEASRRAHEADTRALREVVRYEATRSKTLAALAKAVEAKDDAKAAEARTALETLDGAFVATLDRAESGGPAAKASGSGDHAPQGAPKAAPKAGRAGGGDETPGAEKPAGRKAGGASSPSEAPKDRSPTRPSGEGKMSSSDPEDDVAADPLRDDLFGDLDDDLGE